MVRGFAHCLPSLPQKLGCRFESLQGLEFASFSVCHFLARFVQGFLKALHFLPLFHQVMVLVSQSTENEWNFNAVKICRWADPSHHKAKLISDLIHWLIAWLLHQHACCRQFAAQLVDCKQIRIGPFSAIMIITTATIASTTTLIVSSTNSSSSTNGGSSIVSNPERCNSRFFTNYSLYWEVSRTHKLMGQQCCMWNRCIIVQPPDAKGQLSYTFGQSWSLCLLLLL